LDTQFLVVNRLTDLPADLAVIGGRYDGSRCRTGAATNSITAVLVRSLPAKGSKPRDIYVPAYRRHRGEDAGDGPGLAAAGSNVTTEKLKEAGQDRTPKEAA
jgi:hypothetical protein